MPSWSVRTVLGCLVFACLVPGIVVAGILFLHEYRNGRAQLEKDTIQMARALAQAVDAHLLKAQVAAQSLSTAGSLSKRHFADFHRRASGLLAATDPGTNFVLSDKNGQQIVNTLKEFGQPLPRHGNPELMRRVFETGKPAISDLFVGAVTRRPIMSIDVPVVLDGDIAYVLSIGIRPEIFNAILQKQNLPPDWVVAIFDTQGTIVARTHAAEQLVGQKGSADFIQRIREVPEGTMEGTTREGIPVLSAFSRSAATGWSVGIGIPRQALEAEFRQSLFRIAAGIAGLFSIGLALAWLMGGRIANSIRALTAPALALGAGEAVPVPRLHIKEAAEVADAISSTSVLLSQRTTERDLARRELEKHREDLEDLVAERTNRLEQILESAGEGIFGVDGDNRLTFANRAAAELLGWPSPDSMLGLTQPAATGHALADGQPCQDCCPICQTLKDGQTRRVQDEFFGRRDGTVMPVRYVVSPQVRNGNVVGAVVAFEDISTQRAAEQALRELNDQLMAARDRAEAASQAKSDFVANMSHEIRTPMNAILGLSRLLEDAPLGQQERDHVSKIEISARSLLGILNDILDFSKIEAGRLELEETPFSLEEVLSKVSIIVSANARNKDIETLVEVSPEVPGLLVGDPLRLQQVLLNLAGNAVKFTDRGKVVLAVQKAAETESGVTLEFSVRDTGIGIAPEHRDRLFEAFSQADTSTSRRYGGTGLGLAISSRLVALMGGTISCSSEVGQGSDFRFTANFGPMEGAELPAKASPVAASSLAGRRILVVDDNEINQQITGAILRRAGAEFEVASDGQMAIGMLEREPGRFDAVLMDIQMPVVDGYEATRIIRSRLKLTALPIIAMTANAMASDRKEAEAAGMNVHVAKPIAPEALVATLVAQISESGRPTREPSASPPAASLPELPADLPGIDLRTALLRLGGDRALWISLLRQFESSEGTTVADARQLLKAGRAEETAGRMHRLRGIAANLGAIEVARLAVDLEAAIKDRLEEKLPDLLHRLEGALSAVFRIARQLPAPAGAAAGTSSRPAQRETLAGLLQRLGGNDLGALDQFQALRPAIEAVADPQAVQALAAAIETLDFAAAQRLLQDIMTTGDVQA